jgi:xanthine dehydrogenase accessory factor
LACRRPRALAGAPRAIEAAGRERIRHAPVAGRLIVLRDIGDPVVAGEPVARIGAHPLPTPIGGTLRGMLRDGMAV